MTPEYLTLADPEAEQAIYAHMHAYDESERMSYAQIGLMARAVERRMLWRHRTDPVDGFPCRSFARWVRICCPYAYSTVYAALRDVEELSDVPADDLAEIPQSNLRTMKQLSGGVRKRPEVLAAAKSQRAEEFVETIKAKFPLQHIESKRPLRFNPPESAVSKIEEALTLAMEHGATNRDDALELIAATAMQVWQEEKYVETMERTPTADTVGTGAALPKLDRGWIS